MGKGLPSMAALLGLVAVAGFQNRDKIAEMLGQRGGGQPGAGDGDGLGGLLGRLGESFGVGGGGNDRGMLSSDRGAEDDDIVGGGLGELLDRFRQNGEGDVADSWVRQGPNQQLSPAQLERAVGPELLDTLSQQTGLSRDELVARLSRDLPDAVDKYTPEGRLPTRSGGQRA